MRLENKSAFRKIPFAEAEQYSIKILKKCHFENDIFKNIFCKISLSKSGTEYNGGAGMAVKNEIALVTQENIRNKIYTIRGQRVMLDSDLAAIYGYTTKAFNQQVARNKEKFEEDFMFQLTLEETENLSRCNFCTSIIQTKGMKGGRTYYPYAFTEQGIYNQSTSSCGLR